MPRKRMIDPEFWSDEEIGESWPFDARLFYIGVWNFADDEGKLKANPKLLKSEIFPYDKKVNINRIEIIKSIVSKKILWYEINGQEYGWIKNFLIHQRIDRPTKSILPDPPQELKKKFVEGSTNPRRRLAPNLKEEKLNKEKLSKENIYPPEFEAFWKPYPRKVEKIDAFFTWKTLTKKQQQEVIIAAGNYKTYVESKGIADEYIKHPKTFLNKKKQRWKDWLEPPKTAQTKKIDPAKKAWLEKKDDEEN